VTFLLRCWMRKRPASEGGPHREKQVPHFVRDDTVLCLERGRSHGVAIVRTWGAAVLRPYAPTPIPQSQMAAHAMPARHRRVRHTPRLHTRDRLLALLPSGHLPRPFNRLRHSLHNRRVSCTNLPARFFLPRIPPCAYHCRGDPCASRATHRSTCQRFTSPYFGSRRSSTTSRSSSPHARRDLQASRESVPTPDHPVIPFPKPVQPASPRQPRRNCLRRLMRFTQHSYQNCVVIVRST
jgi:hypothetical protein